MGYRIIETIICIISVTYFIEKESINMKRIELSLLIFIITLSCSILYNPININASSIDTSTNNLVMNNNSDYDDELMGFLNIQDQITKTLS